MPYTIAKNDDGEFCVYRADDDGQPQGETLGCHDTKEKAVAQIGAIESNEQQALPVQFLRGYAQRADALQDEEPVRYVVSTEGVKRDGLDLKATDWDVSNYIRHPVVIWAHDYSKLPIGKAAVSFDSTNMLADITYDSADEFAMQVRGKALKGLVAASVAWNTRKDGKNELLEISNVPIPADPEALVQTARAGLRALAVGILQTLAEEPDGTLADESVWCGVGLAMRGLFEHADGSDEGARRKVYNDLARLYKRLGKTPPEFMEAQRLNALNREQRGGLFLEDEMTIEQRYGVVLSKRIKERLGEAKTYLKAVGEIINEVLASAAPKPEQEAAEPELQRILDQLNQFEVNNGKRGTADADQ